MKLLFTIIITALLLQPGQPILTFQKKIETHADFILADPLGNLFTITNKTITKYNEQGVVQKEFSSNLLGAISYADVSDPFRILLFYRDFNQIIFLDNTLSEIHSPVNLGDLKIEESEIACSSANGGFWVYNNISKQLAYFDKQLQKNNESIFLNSILNTDQKPEFLIEKSDYVFMYVPETGILIFDKFGAYFKTLNLGKTAQFQVDDNKIIYMQDNKILKYNMKLLETSSCQLPDSIKDVKSFALVQNKLYLQKKESVTMYLLQE